MFRVLLEIYLFSAANGLLMVALDRTLGFAAPKWKVFAPSQRGRPVAVVT